MSDYRFTISTLPRIRFGAGSVQEIPHLIHEFGTPVLLVTGAQSLCNGPRWSTLIEMLDRAGVPWQHTRITGEPTPDFIDDNVRRFRSDNIRAVIGIGGGSVLDAAKAIAGLLPFGNSVMDHLEGVGAELPYRGPALPFIAVPTTAGTGSEATKNAVISVHGVDGFKKSFRHDSLVARYAVVDPDLLASCPPALIAANGMDALTQLIESYVSTNANAFTDALAISGLAAARAGLLPWYDGGAAAHEAHAHMADAALISGITLAQAGLGSVHGLAAPLGAFFPIAHGVVCGTLVAAATAENIAALRARDPQHSALAKYAHVAELLTGIPYSSIAAAHAALVDCLSDWTARMQLPRLQTLGVERADFARIVAGCRGNSMKTNPVTLSDAEVTNILVSRW